MVEMEPPMENCYKETAHEEFEVETFTGEN
jgi:hypothetical protein